MSDSADTSPLYVVGTSSEVNARPFDAEKPLTAKEKEQQKEINERREFLANVAKLALRHAADSRRRYDYEWMVRDLFRRGYQFSRYQPTSQTVVLASRQTARIPINIVAAQLRSIRNQVTSFRPKFEVLPRYTQEESRVQARYAGKLLDYYFDHLKLKKKIKETVTQGLMYSIGGPWQVVFDEEKKEVVIWLLDPFDFYFDPLAESIDDAEYCIKAVRRPLAEVIYNQEYDKLARLEVTGGESRLAVSEYKQFMVQALRYVTQYSREESPTVILFEGYFRVRDKETGKPHLRKIVWTDQNFTPLVYEDLEENEYDFALYQADLNPKEILGESWMKHVMPLNRVLNSLESSVYEYNYRVAKGRIVVDRDSGVRAIHNVHGEIISKNKGAEVRALDMPGLPIATGNQIERIGRYLEDLGGVHEATLGRMPAGVRSGIGIAELKQSDASSQDDLVDNLEDFLSDVGSKLLRKIAKHYTTLQVIKDLGYREQEAKYFAVIGEDGKPNRKKGEEVRKGQVKIGPDWLDLAIIGADNNIRVTIGSWLGYTKEMMQEKTLKLLELGAIDQKTFLKTWEFGDIDTIVEQTRKEMILKSYINKPQDPNIPTVDPYVENDMMVLEGKDMPVDAHDDHVFHNIVHQEALGKGRDDLVGKHMELHNMYIGQQYGQAPAPVQPQQPAMGGQPDMQGQLPPTGAGMQPQQPPAQPQQGMEPADMSRSLAIQGNLQDQLPNGLQ